MGSPVARSKLQRPLDSYQAQDLEAVRQAWAHSLAKLKTYVDAEIHKIDRKARKTPSDSRYEQSLIDQKNCIMDELNAALVPEELEDAGLCHQLGMEVATPLIFLNTANIDGLESATELADHLPQVGAAACLPKELQGCCYIRWLRTT
jgi:hypothetical protein